MQRKTSWGLGRSMATFSAFWALAHVVRGSMAHLPLGSASGVHERYRRQTTDGQAISYSERERMFTFAKNKEKIM